MNKRKWRKDRIEAEKREDILDILFANEYSTEKQDHPVDILFTEGNAESAKPKLLCPRCKIRERDGHDYCRECTREKQRTYSSPDYISPRERIAQLETERDRMALHIQNIEREKRQLRESLEEYKKLLQAFYENSEDC